jgi:hypothetical protein
VLPFRDARKEPPAFCIPHRQVEPKLSFIGWTVLEGFPIRVRPKLSDLPTVECMQ